MDGQNIQPQKVLIIIGGQQGAGKDTKAKFIEETLTNVGFMMPVEHARFAATLYGMQAVVEHSDLDKAMQKKNGPFLQEAGDLVRKHYGQEFLISRVRDHVDQFFNVTKNRRSAVIIVDARVENEIKLSDYFKEKWGAKTISFYIDTPEDIRRERLGALFRENTSHKTESELLKIKSQFDHVISNAAYSDESDCKIAEILVKEGLIHDAATDLGDIVESFNTTFRMWEDIYKSRANFAWDYDKEGRKILKVSEVSAYKQPEASEVSGMISQTESTLSKIDPSPVGLSQN